MPSIITIKYILEKTIMNKMICGFILSATLLGWDSDFYLSCAENNWAEVQYLSTIDPAWKFDGIGNNPATGSNSKLLTLKCVSSPTAPGEINPGTFYFSILTNNNGYRSLWGGEPYSASHISVNLNDYSETIKYQGLHYYFNLNPYKAYFTATAGKTYTILFNSNPTSTVDASTRCVVLEFDSSPATTMTHSSAGNNSPLHGVTVAEIIFEVDCGTSQPPTDQSYYVRAYFSDGYTGSYDSWSNALIASNSAPPTLGYNNRYWAYISIPAPYDGNIVNYYTMTTENTNMPANSNIDNAVLLWDNNNGANYSENFLVLSDDKFFSPEGISLDPVYPNPFNPATTISYSVDRYTEVEITIFNLLGERIQTLLKDEVHPGDHKIHWDASHVESGVYLVQMITGSKKSIQKITLIK